MRSFLPSLAILGVLALVALRVAWVTRGRPIVAGARRPAALAFVTAIALQAAHFAEEAGTGFHNRFPELIGLEPMTFYGFVAFNLGWIVIWIASVPGLGFGRTGARFAAWFLCLTAIVNGIAHPALAVITQGYFPGLVTAPVLGLAGIRLFRRLRQLQAVAENGARL
ncbi:MAG: HXXEE domain-containing protein [Pseudomonadota bacterium]